MINVGARIRTTPKAKRKNPRINLKKKLYKIYLIIWIDVLYFCAHIQHKLYNNLKFYPRKSIDQIRFI